MAACAKKDEPVIKAPDSLPPAVQAANYDNDIGWMGMFNSNLVGWLENENRLGELCHASADSLADANCRAQKLAPDSFSVQLHSGPAKTAPVAGSLLMIATPGKGLSAFFVPPDNRAAQPITPDLFDRDWGYGPPYFHISIVERNGQWVRLAEDPIPGGSWVNMDDISTAPITESIEQGNILTTPYGDLFVLRIDDGAVIGRPEQAVDMWCGNGPPPPPRMDSTEVRVESDSLFTHTGHLRVKFKYTRGC